MLRGQLKIGDIIKLYTWFGFIFMEVKQRKTGEVYLSSEKEDVSLPIDKLHFKSKYLSSISRWSFYKKGEHQFGEYVEYEELETEPVKPKRYTLESFM